MKKKYPDGFNPNRLTFEQGIKRLREAVEKAGLDSTRIVTSRDPVARKATDALRVRNVPEGFDKWQLPVYLDEPSQLFISVGQPGTKVPRHSHDEGNGIRFMVAGSIRHGDLELTAGDWMYIPAGADYEFEVGRLGAIMCYCYCCSCA